MHPFSFDTVVLPQTHILMALMFSAESLLEFRHNPSLRLVFDLRDLKVT